MAIDVGELRATLQLDREDFQRDLSQSQSSFQQLGAVAQQAGSEVAKAYQQAATEAKKSGDAAKTAAQTANTARAASLDAVEALRRKEVDLQRARTSGDTEKIARAEANLESARRKVEIAAGREATATERATDAIERAVTAAQRADTAFRQMGQSAAQGMNQASEEVGRSNPFAALANSARESGQEAGENLAGGLPAPIARAVAATGPVGTAIMAVAAVGLMAGKALAENISKGLEVNAAKAFDTVKFGWTEQQAAEAGKAAADAFGNAYGESVQANRQTAGLAIQSGLLDGNATAEQIQPVIEKLDTVTSILGTDIPETARAAGQMIRTGMAKDATEALDLLTVAQQNGLNVSGDLMDTLTEYGTQFRKVGLDGVTTLGVISQMWKAGARDTDVAADALKEFADKSIDGSKTTIAAYEAMGLNADDTMAKLAGGGQTARDTLQQVWDKLSGVRDNVKRNEIGIALFGEKWIDLGGAINGMDLSTASQQLGDVAGAAQRAGDGISGASDDIQAAKNKLSIAADEVRGRLAEAFAPSISEAAQWVSDHVDEISKGLEILGGVAGIAAAAVGGMFGIALGGAAVVQQALSRVAEGFLKVAKYALEAMSHIPGMGDLAKGNIALIDSQLKMVEGWKKGADAASDFAAEVLKGSYSIAGASAELFTSEKRAKTATDAFGNLGIKVREVPDKKQIVIEDNSPATMKKLADLGIKVQTLPDGTVYIDAQDEDAKTKIAELLKPGTKVVTIQAVAADQAVASALSAITGSPWAVAAASARTALTFAQNGGSITSQVAGKTRPPATSNPKPETVVQETSEERDKRLKAEAAAAAKAEAARKKTEKEQAAAAKKASDAQAKIPGLERALALAEQRYRELKPNASTSSRMSAQDSVTKAREALEKARTDAKGTTTTTTSDGKPVTVTGDGKGGTVQVGTGSNPLQVEPANSAQGDGMRVFVTNMPAGGVGGGIKLSLFANGGVEDHRAQIARGGDMRVWAEPETEGEAYIPLARSKRGRSMGILRQVAARFGQRLTAFDNGGIVPNAGVTGGTIQLGDVSSAGITTQEQQDAWDTIRQQFPAASLNSATRTQDVGSGFDFHMAGEAIDIGGSPALMMQIAEWIATTYPNSRELIHGPGFAKQIKNGKIVGDGGGSYGYYAGAGRHDDHVHWTPPSGYTFGGGAAVVAADGKAIPLGAVGLTASSTPDDVAKAIIGEGRKRGYSDEDIRKILATAFGESGLVMQNSKDGPWNGIFQQDASYKGRDDPNTNIRGFFDELDKGSKDHTIEQRIVGVQQHHDADYLGVSAGDATYAENTITNRQAEADAIFDRVQASVPMSTTATGATPTGTDTKTTTGTGVGQNVYVTGGKLDSIGTGGGSQFKFSLFANGGIEDHAPQIARAGDMRVWAEPETGGEAYIPLSPAKRPRSIALWHETGRRLGVTGYAGGGISLPKVEAPKIAPTLGPGMALPIPAAATAPVGVGAAVGAGAKAFDPLAALGLGAGAQQGSVAGTGETVTPQQYAMQRTLQMGGDLAKIGVQALKEILLPSGLESSQAGNVVSLIKSVGQGISSSAEKKRTTTTTAKSQDGSRVSQTTNNFYVSSADEVVRAQRTKEGQDALGYDGRFV
ncbi:phage tail tape measure protein [Tsukamurella sp. NPDC003166]|uniref:phage tail tape measure protein n=1 Tax=Tsukamurella sp. NPDC003166 TaxID=3154444 RepID=UPI0033BCB95E